MVAHRKPRHLRLWSTVDVRGPEECWNAKTIGRDGYGRFSESIGGGKIRTFASHRVAWELSNGPIPQGILVCHACDNRRCCNPSHLFLGSHNDNMADMVAKARHSNRHKRACARGHEYSVENTYLWHGSRHCRACTRLNGRAYKARKAAASVELAQ